MTTFYLQTFGCSLNHSDSEQMVGQLTEAQFKPVTTPEEADILIFNTCTVKNSSERKFFKLFEEIKQQYPYKTIIITGCIAQTDFKKLKGYSLLGTNQIHHIVEVVEEALNENPTRLLKRDEFPPLNLPRIRKNEVVGIIPINRGCLSQCTFCKTKSARGHLQSYPPAEIIDQVKKAIQDGVKEIWLTSQDTGCYGFDINTNLPALLNELVKISGNFKIRLGMMNPEHCLKISAELLPLLAHPKIFKFLHLPIQSGSDKVLMEMNRKNTVKEFIQLVTELRQNIPQITLTTDIIVGYPTETEDDHWSTLNLLREVCLDNVNIAKFSARPNTPAAELDQLPGEIIKKRSGVLSSIFHNISQMQNEKWIGWEGEILIEEKGKIPSQWVGRNLSYKPIIVNGDFELGQIARVKIISAGIFGLKGRIVFNYLKKEN